MKSVWVVRRRFPVKDVKGTADDDRCLGDRKFAAPVFAALESPFGAGFSENWLFESDVDGTIPDGAGSTSSHIEILVLKFRISFVPSILLDRKLSLGLDHSQEISVTAAEIPAPKYQGCRKTRAVPFAVISSISFAPALDSK